MYERETNSLDFIDPRHHRYIGEPIAYSGRDVFVYKPDPTYVVKVDIEMCGNEDEWTTWKMCSDEVRPYLAPCSWISCCGMLLVMKRVVPIAEGMSYNYLIEVMNKLPLEIGDRGFDNIGYYLGRIVYCDYEFSKWSTPEDYDKFPKGYYR